MYNVHVHCAVYAACSAQHLSAVNPESSNENDELFHYQYLHLQSDEVFHSKYLHLILICRQDNER